MVRCQPLACRCSDTITARAVTKTIPPIAQADKLAACAAFISGNHGGRLWFLGTLSKGFRGLRLLAHGRTAKVSGVLVRAVAG